MKFSKGGFKNLVHSAVCQQHLSPLGDGRTDANRLDSPTWQVVPSCDLTSACTELCSERAGRDRGSPSTLLPLAPFQPPLNVFSPPPESAVHPAPQIAYDSRAISSRGFELNWSEQYHLCLLKGRSGSHCCSAEKNHEGGHGGQKSCYLQPSKPVFHMQSAQLAPLWGGVSSEQSALPPSFYTFLPLPSL